MKRILKFIMWFLVGFVGVVVFYFIAERILSRIGVGGDDSKDGQVTVYILSNGVHTDIVVPVVNDLKDWRTDFPYKNTSGNDSTAGLLAIGWGDKGFYLETPTWADLKVSTALKALTGLSTAALHATFYHELKEGKACRKIVISKEHYLDLVHFIEKSLIRNYRNESVHIETSANYGTHDAFYEARRRYSIFHTCNTWTNNALKSCGQKACLWTAFDSGIFKQYSVD